VNDAPVQAPPQPAAEAAHPAVAPSPPSPPQTWTPPRRRSVVVVLIALIGVAAVLATLAAWDLPPFRGDAQSTDNAYVRGRTTVIAPQVSGYVTEVLVHDYQLVSSGQVLARIDDRTYRARLEQAKANLDAAIATLNNSTQARASRAATLQSQVAGLGNAHAQLSRARADMARAEELSGDGSISVREKDQTLAALRQAEAQVRQAVASNEIARQDIRTVDVGRGALEAQVESARALLHSAAIDLEHTVIVSPEAGQLGEIGARTGVYVTNGTQLMALVPGERWIIANYKESQTSEMAPGQRATFTVDALNGATLTGKLELLSPAAGSEFAVLKPDNATGNFVKVPQRIGVRIAIDPGQKLLERLRPGMSVEVRVHTGPAP
jgi:multidrug resistance efflux pump